MSENQDLAQAIKAEPTSQPKKGGLSLTRSLIILVIIYATGEILSQYITLTFPAALLWSELVMWLIIVLWLLIAVRPPFMAWLKRQRAENG